MQLASMISSADIKDADRSKEKTDSALFNTEHLRADIGIRSVRGGAIGLLSQGIMSALRLVSVVVLARMVIPEHFGLIGMVTSLTVLAERFQDLGLGDAVVQRKEITHQQVSNLFWANLCVSALLSTVVSLAARMVAWFYGDPRLTWITVAFACNFVCSGVAIQHQALIRRQMRFGQFATIQIVSVTFGLAVAIVMAMFGFGYWALIWKEIARSAMNTVLAWSFCRWRPSFPSRSVGIKPLLHFGYNVTGFNMLYYLTTNVDAVLIGKWCGAVSVGLYSRARQLTILPVSQFVFKRNENDSTKHVLVLQIAAGLDEIV